MGEGWAVRLGRGCMRAGRGGDLPAFGPAPGTSTPRQPRRGAGRMEVRDMDRRTLLKGGGAAVAGLTMLRVAGPAHAFPGEPGEEEVLHWVGEARRPRISPTCWIGSSWSPGTRRPTTSSSSATSPSRTSSRRTGACASAAWSAGRRR